ncbi:hypothetical protein J4226_00760 [Candidatus Pacearchaeota archaeon]|nr:hypothetical protein [Candidatus Pacearchaeota archaeon]
MVEAIDFLIEGGEIKGNSAKDFRTLPTWGSRTNIAYSKVFGEVQNSNMSHGWDVCEYADYGCLAALIGDIFLNTCSADYNSCETKCMRDYGGSR